jgi:hypothetical protein
MEKKPVKNLLLLLMVALGISFTSPVNAQVQYEGFYLGLHWEKNGTVNSRIGIFNTKKGYFIADVGWPTYLAALAEWSDNDSVKHVNGEQIRLFSFRGGLPIIPTEHGFFSIDLCGEMLSMRCQLDSVNTKLKKVTAIPVSIGPSWAQSYGERFHTVTALNYGIAYSELRDGDKHRYHSRIGIDLYIHFWIAGNLVLYGNIGYGYFPKGLSTTWPRNKHVGASLIAVGLAF